MSVQLSEIRQMANAVFNAIESSGLTELDPEHGLYWTLDSADAWDMTAEPQLLVGDLADDIGDIRKDITEYNDISASIAWHTLDHLIGVLTAVSQQCKDRNGLLEREVI